MGLEDEEDDSRPQLDDANMDPGRDDDSTDDEEDEGTRTSSTKDRDKWVVKLRFIQDGSSLHAYETSNGISNLIPGCEQERKGKEPASMLICHIRQIM